jgi:hypothetical protein
MLKLNHPRPGRGTRQHLNDKFSSVRSVFRMCIAHNSWCHTITFVSLFRLR